MGTDENIKERDEGTCPSHESVHVLLTEFFAQTDMFYHGSLHM
jgi:hypothetical protein